VLVAVAVETTVKAMETQESLYATSTAVAQDNAVEATVKAKEIQEAVDATFETKQAGGTPTAASGSAPPVVTTGPTSTVSAVIPTPAVTSTVTPTPTPVPTLVPAPSPVPTQLITGLSKAAHRLVQAVSITSYRVTSSRTLT
jgi:hypothetical protein